jgi:hypothetical protein
MPFGKYKGAEVGTLPINYLRWLRTTELRPELEEAIGAALKAHAAGERSQSEGARWAYEAPFSGGLNRLLLRELVQAGYRQLALKYHPDRPGGDTRKMQQLNLLMQTVRLQLGE